jgi:predicted DCC family thiol-disulfide oxidoreductase YuxK
VRSPLGPSALLYDSDCGFCKWSLDKVLAWDRRRRLRPVAIQSPEGERLLAGMTGEERLASWHLVLPSGEVRSGGAAAEPLARLLPGGRPLAAAFAAFPGATDRGYRWVADHRSALARLVRADRDRPLRRCGA